MKIFSQEIKDGLKEKIQASASIAYSIPIESVKDSKLSLEIIKACKCDTEHKASEGLYPTKSILVSTVWNLNDDVFDPQETWPARSTPIDKPTNLEHDETKIVGHMVDSWPINDKGEIIPEETAVDELPDLYHIVNSAVIYTLWQDKERSDRAQKLIAQIEAGEKFVSMECLFKGFDYAVKSPDGSSHVIARSAETAFLTKHLRAYGGDGIYQGHKVGRLLRNITFSAKGYVDKPANPDSIILKGEEFSRSTTNQNSVVFQEDGVLIFSSKAAHELENQTMSDVNKVEELTKKIAELEAKSAADLKAANDKIAELTQSVDSGKAEVKTLSESLVAEKAKSDELVKSLDESKASLDKVNSELASVKASELKAKRISKLVAGKVTKEVAEAKVEKFANLNDEQFDIVADALIAAVAPVIDEDVDIDPNANTTPTDATVVVDKTEANGTQITTSEDETDKTQDTVKASIADWLKNKLELKD